MTSPRALHRATFLVDYGTVLITGGIGELSQPDGLLTAEIFDPAGGTSGAFRSTMYPPLFARSFHRATLLLNMDPMIDGTVLITGGNSSRTAVIFDPVSESFSAIDDLMSSARSGHTATLLLNGKVLITGGRDSNDFLKTAELYDPATQMFTPTGEMTAIRHRHTATLLLQDGTVLVAGGQEASGGILATAEIFDPQYGTFTAVGLMTKPRGVDHTATLLEDGTVLLVGGRQLNPPFSSEPTADLFTPEVPPETGTFMEATGHMKGLRNFHAATLLWDGTVLVAGGRIAETTTTFRAEVYDPLTEVFTETDHLTVERDFHTATLLDDGTVLIAGGFSQQGNASVIEPSAEIFIFVP
jgi:hypothetical protein